MFDVDQVSAVAPDDRSLKAAQKTATPSKWSSLGRSERALWGLCSGSGSSRYQVTVDLKDLAVKCSCPSRKIPCKHALALMLLVARGSTTVTEAAPPDFTSDWLEGRDARAKKKAETAATRGPTDEAAKAKREAKRESKVDQGLVGLREWLTDLGRTGLSTLEARPEAIEEQAARLVDAQAPGMASRLRRVADEVGTGGDWPLRVAQKLGRLALVVEAWGRRDTHPDGVVHDLRAIIGFPLRAEQVLASQPQLEDRFVVLGQIEEDDGDKLRAMRTWMWAQTRACPVLLLQFAFGHQPYEHRFTVGASQSMKVAFHPSAYPLRITIAERSGTPRPAGHGARADSVAGFLQAQAQALAADPFLDALPCALAQVTPVPASPVQVADREHALPLTPGAHWRLIAASRGQPVDVFGEWDGAALRPLSVSTTEGLVAL
ncbi:MAG: SWIM zinc finger domain-containing protein [Myxococcales bacterium]|nr:SWIM zinc finger domain-containing protein [Myxococcales bacterium]